MPPAKIVRKHRNESNLCKLNRLKSEGSHDEPAAHIAYRRCCEIGNNKKEHGKAIESPYKPLRIKERACVKSLERNKNNGSHENPNKLNTKERPINTRKSYKSCQKK